jgi:Beta-lactamase enzyme family
MRTMNHSERNRADIPQIRAGRSALVYTGVARARGTSVIREPAHAGRLKAWEGVAFAIVFGVMAGFVVAAVFSAVQHGAQPRTHPGRSSAGLGEHRLGQPGQPAHSSQQGGGQSTTSGASELSLNEQLAVALRPVVAGGSGELAVGITDLTTGVRLLYHRGEHIHTASIVKADILATLLLQHQRERAPLSSEQTELATSMIEDSNNDSATDLWNMVGGATGIATANRSLGLWHTRPGQAGYWGLTSTTVLDQLHLLRDLASRRSVLSDASRDYEMSLMRDVEADQRWGVPIVAAPDTRFAVKNGWLPDPDRWVINSIGVVQRAGQTLLIAVMSNGQQSEAAGIARVEAAATAAAKLITTESG